MPSGTYATRDALAKTPYFPENISYLALILGETGNSRRNLCLDGSGKNRAFPERFPGEFLEGSQIRDQDAKWVNLFMEELVFQFQSTVRRSDHAQSTPFSRANEEPQHQSQDRPKNIQRKLKRKITI